MGRLTAVQAQDFAGAKWALGLRLRDVDDHEVERAFDAGEILRTHVLRPTWHFIAPVDIRWLLALTGPRIVARNAPMYRKLGLDATTLRRGVAAIVRALEREGPLTRFELRDVLGRSRISGQAPQRVYYVLMHAELRGVICSGPRRGKQFTWALLERRAPEAAPLARDDALARIAGRYFATRGPATVHDFAKWTGLTLADARRGLEAVRTGLDEETRNGRTYFAPRDSASGAAAGPRVHLLSVYDEYISSYRDHHAIVSPEHGRLLVGQGSALAWVLVIDGRVVGTWRRLLSRDEVVVEARPFVTLSARDRAALDAAARRYGRHLGLPVRVTMA